MIPGTEEEPTCSQNMIWNNLYFGGPIGAIDCNFWCSHVTLKRAESANRFLQDRRLELSIAQVSAEGFRSFPPAMRSKCGFPSGGVRVNPSVEVTCECAMVTGLDLSYVSWQQVADLIFSASAATRVGAWADKTARWPVETLIRSVKRREEAALQQGFRCKGAGRYWQLTCTVFFRLWSIAVARVKESVVILMDGNVAIKPNSTECTNVNIKTVEL